MIILNKNFKILFLLFTLTLTNNLKSIRIENVDNQQINNQLDNSNQIEKSQAKKFNLNQYTINDKVIHEKKIIENLFPVFLTLIVTSIIPIVKTIDDIRKTSYLPYPKILSKILGFTTVCFFGALITGYSSIRKTSQFDEQIKNYESKDNIKLLLYDDKIIKKYQKPSKLAQLKRFISYQASSIINDTELLTFAWCTGYFLTFTLYWMLTV
ncbi:hypothetical protein GF322_03905 [Candidatus Dependentiae bacterium]|nr:hypothetical protein [Candidatus Dependentiae bacterium]